MNLTFNIDSSLAPRQFTIKPEPGVTDDEIRVRAHPDIGVFDILDASGVRIGLLMGFPIDLQKRCVLSGPLKVTIPGSFGIEATAEMILDRLGGRFLLLLNISGKSRIYPDCAAQVPCVYSPEKGVAGSTADAILSDAKYEALFRYDLYAALDIDNDGWFPGGMTAHKGVERLLPNHVLDLRDWSQKRYWPLETVERTQSPESSLEEISQIIRIQLEALLNGPKKVVQALTAGHETRVMLACAFPYLDSIEFVTLEGDTRRADDTVISRRIAHDLGLNHSMLPRVTADEATVARYMRRGGHCVGGPNRLTHPSLAVLRENHVFVGGGIGEVGRAFFWHGEDRQDALLTGKLLAGRMGLPTEPRLEDRLDDWLKGLQGIDSLIALDLAYLEQRVGPWGGAQMFSDPTLIRHNPLGTARSIKLMLGLPDAWKRQSVLTTGIIRMHWPELMSYPFNSQGVVRDLLKQVGRVARRPQLIARKLRKMRR
ncbi:hypothetical protein D6850_18395 [Roseovarius spongiae]|uniref:Asparagine synthetase domain-containing protein n=1 Tax=Roseovarius spongiae TaxID=2320272 RepID=A0A3A8B1L7_9RHOB|nr:hypothetical protein [Roseovarius spongiae]RKF12440.1 hypothetical protein D6850_18395 [Roseovarius spongiae]